MSFSTFQGQHLAGGRRLITAHSSNGIIFVSAESVKEIRRVG